MRSRCLPGIVALLAVLLTVSCEPASDRAGPPATEAVGGAMQVAEAPPPVRAKRAALSESAADAAAPVPQEPGAERLIVKTAQLALVVPEYEGWIATVRTTVDGVGGYLVNASMHQVSQAARRGNLTLRVPQADFQAVFEALKASARKVESERVGGRDVTEEYTDLEARLDNQRRAETRLQAIMEQAGTVEDILAVERELTRVRERIEVMEGRRRYLRQRVDMAAIQVDWHEPYPVAGGRSGTPFWGRVEAGLDSGLEAFGRMVELVIAVGIGAIPVVIGLALAGWLLLRLVRWFRGQSLL